MYRNLTSVYLLVLVTVVTVSASDVSTSKGITLTVAFQEPGLPLQLSNATSTAGSLFERATVKNISQHLVKSIIFGVAVFDETSSSMAPALVLKGASVLTNIAPGGEAGVDLRFMSHSDVNSRLKKRGITTGVADLGVIKVEFDDGSSWEFDPEPRGFRPKPQMSLVRANAAKICGANRTAHLVETAQEAKVIKPYGHFNCESTQDCIYCTNGNNSCTVSGCTTGGLGCSLDCAHQTCHYNP